MEDLKGGLLWKAILYWSGMGDADGVMYVYSHNGSRFDTVEVLHQILCFSDEMPSDLLSSNGKLISVRWRNLIFRDSMLITMASLSKSCLGAGISVDDEGWSLPHKYLQNCVDPQEILRRLHGEVAWSELEPYMDWFN